MLNKTFCQEIIPEDFADMSTVFLRSPNIHEYLKTSLQIRKSAVPLTKDRKLFAKVADFGKELIWLHTYGERLHDANHPRGQIPAGKAHCMKAIPDQEDKYPNAFHYEESNNNSTSATACSLLYILRFGRSKSPAWRSFNLGSVIACGTGVARSHHHLMTSVPCLDAWIYPRAAWTTLVLEKTTEGTQAEATSWSCTR